MRYVSLAVVLFGFWLILSGFLTPGLMTFGVLTSLAAVAIAARMQAVDDEGHPIQLLVGGLTYIPWLIWEIVKAAWSVSKIILDPKLPISPSIATIHASQKSAVGVNVYANSITLTPGTITVAENGNELVVHAVVKEGIEDLKGGGMDRRVTRFEGLE